MHYAFFRVAANDPELGTTALNTFLRSHSIVSIDRQFVADGERSFWSICVAVAEQPQSVDKSRRRGAVDYRDVLPPEAFAVFTKLRSLRNQIAEQQAAPAYAIFTNEQLAEMAQLKDVSRSAMSSIVGIGEKRMEMYAEAFLSVLKEAYG